MCKSRFVWGLVRFCGLECDVLALLERATGGLCWVHPQVYYLFGVGCVFVWGLLCWFGGYMFGVCGI